MSISKIITDQTLVLELISKVQLKDTLLLTYFNQHSFNILYKDREFKSLVEDEFQIYLDGVGMYLALKFLGQNVNSKFNASEINEHIFSILANESIPVVLIGGRFNIKLLNKCPLNLVKYFNGYEDIQNKQLVFDEIRRLDVKTIIIGMGVPLQEKLTFEISNKIPNLQIICVGNFLEFYFGTISRAPRLLHNSGFEWLFRLLTEPRRLWKRYLIGIPLFVFRIIKMKVTYNEK